MPTTTAKQPIKIKDFLSFCALEARLIKENNSVTITVTKSIAIARDTNGETAGDFVIVTVNPLPVADAGTNDSICETDSFVLGTIWSNCWICLCR